MISEQIYGGNFWPPCAKGDTMNNFSLSLVLSFPRRVLWNDLYVPDYPEDARERANDRRGIRRNVSLRLRVTQGSYNSAIKFK